jgi:hypothetical protein
VISEGKSSVSFFRPSDGLEYLSFRRFLRLEIKHTARLDEEDLDKGYLFSESLEGLSATAFGVAFRGEIVDFDLLKLRVLRDIYYVELGKDYGTDDKEEFEA